MNEVLKYYLDCGTNNLFDLISNPSVEEDEKKIVIKSFASEIKNHALSEKDLPDGEYLIDTVCANYIDRRISEYLYVQPISFEQCNRALELCGRLQLLDEKFRIRGWEKPNLKNNDIDEVIECFNSKKAGIGIQDRLKGLDKSITEQIMQARAQDSVAICNSALESIDELSRQIVECRNKGIPLPKLTNSNCEKCKEEINRIKETAQRKADLLNHIYETDMKLDMLMASKPHLLPDKWEMIIQLCKEQNGFFETSKLNKWPIPEVKHNDLDKIEKRISLYEIMLDLDSAITASEVDIYSKKNYVTFIECCAKQANNINSCKKNGWEIPNLVHSDPVTKGEKVRRQKEKEEVIKRAKKRFYQLLTAAVVLVVIVGFCIFKYRQGKVQIPFNSGWADGKDLDKVLTRIEDAGFDGYELVPDYSGWERSNVVLGVTIDGKNEYTEGKYIKSGVDVVVNYISSDRLPVGEYLAGWNEKDVHDVVHILEEVGFTKIDTNVVYTTEPLLDGAIKSIFLNDVENAYIDGECYIPSGSPVKIDYYKYMIPMIYSIEDMIGMKETDLLYEFRKAGFTNVQTTEVKHLQNWMPGEAVAKVLIDGNTDYKEGDLIDPDAEIKIYYNQGLSRIDITDVLNNYNTKEWTTVRNNLASKGITNVKLIEVITDDPSENRLISTIRIYGDPYTGGDCFVEGSAEIEIKYYFLRVYMEKPSSYYVNNNSLNYKDVVTEFKNMGYTNILLKRSNDLTTGIINNEGSIKRIEIGNRESFNASDSFDYNERVTIVVYTFAGKGCEDISVNE